ncbi:MAG: hypothetical protein PWQ45_128 [Thermosipho sp. (in: thermotogales)]|jgi:hypothetical protein|nr:hypothetical protein [Thermosipho sp. (in: thermotogales)]
MEEKYMVSIPNFLREKEGANWKDNYILFLNLVKFLNLKSPYNSLYLKNQLEFVYQKLYDLKKSNGI